MADTLNRFAVGSKGDEVVILIPPTRPLNREEALVLAAYLVTIAETLPGLESFEDVLKQVRNT
jgi:hypothetical protein